MKKLAVLLYLTLCACNPVKQVLRSPEKTQVVVNKYLALYPFRSDTITHTTKPDTITNTRFDTLYIPSGLSGVDTVRVTTPCGQVTRIITKTVTQVIHDTTQITTHDRKIEQSLQSLVTAQQVAINQLTADNKDLASARDKWRLYFILLCIADALAIALYVYLKVRPSPIKI